MQWLFNVGRYQVYSVSDSVMVASRELVTPHYSSTGTIQHILATRVKVEHAKELITILSNDSDGNSLTIALTMTSPLVNSPLLESSQKPPILLSYPPSHVGH